MQETATYPCTRPCTRPATKLPDLSWLSEDSLSPPDSDTHVNTIGELNQFLQDNSIPFMQWDPIWVQLGYSNAIEANAAIYDGTGIAKQDILDAWDIIDT